MFKQVRPDVLSELQFRVCRCACCSACMQASLPVLSYTLRVFALLSTWTDTHMDTRANDALDGNAATALEGWYMINMMTANMLNQLL